VSLKQRRTLKCVKSILPPPISDDIQLCEESIEKFLKLSFCLSVPLLFVHVQDGTLKLYLGYRKLPVLFFNGSLGETYVQTNLSASLNGVSSQVLGPTFFAFPSFYCSAVIRLLGAAKTLSRKLKPGCSPFYCSVVILQAAANSVPFSTFFILNCLFNYKMQARVIKNPNSYFSFSLYCSPLDASSRNCTNSLPSKSTNKM